MTSIPGQKVPTYLLIIEASKKYKRLLLQRNTEDVYIYWIYQFFLIRKDRHHRPGVGRHISYHVDNFIYHSSIKTILLLYNRINTRAPFPVRKDLTLQKI